MKRLLISGAVAAVALATIVTGVALAQSDGSSPADTLLGKVAAKLGISQDQLKTAITDSRNEMVDEAVAAGKLTQDQADRIKSEDGVLGGKGFGFELGFAFGGRGPKGEMYGVQLDIASAAADVLGMSKSDLATAVKDQGSLKAVAESKGMSADDFKAALLGKVKDQLNTAVADGKLTQEQADSIYSKVESDIDDVISGAAGPCGMGRGERGGMWKGGGDAPSGGTSFRTRTGAGNF